MYTNAADRQLAEYDRLAEEIRRQDEAVAEWPTVAWLEVESGERSLSEWLLERN